VVHASLRSFPTSEQGLLALTKSPVTPPLCPRYPGRALRDQSGVAEGWIRRGVCPWERRQRVSAAEPRP